MSKKTKHHFEPGEYDVPDEPLLKWYDFNGKFICIGTASQVDILVEERKIQPGFGIYPGEEVK